MDQYHEEQLLKRIQQLEEKVAQLRVSRKVLIQLIERIEREKTELIDQLEKDKQKLKIRNARYAKLLLDRNKQIVMLQRSQQQ